MSKWCFINNEFIPEDDACLQVRDLSIQRGYGVFDFLKIVNSIPVFINDHLNRFYYSADRMYLPVSYSAAELKDIVYSLTRKNEVTDGGVRITLTGGYSKDGYLPSLPNLIITMHNFQPPSEELLEIGIRLMTYPFQRQLPDVKTIDYLMAIWLQPVLKERGADDILYYHNGLVSECPRSNFFIITRENVLITPPSDMLKGITRMKVINLAKEKYTVREEPIQLKDLKEAKAAFITSTTKMILPVSQIDDHVYDPLGRDIIQELQEQFISYQNSYLSSPEDK